MRTAPSRPNIAQPPAAAAASLNVLKTHAMFIAPSIAPASPNLRHWRLYSGHSTACAQVELQVLRSFYKEQGKSPFPKLSWKTGSLHFRFLPVRCKV